MPSPRTIVDTPAGKLRRLRDLQARYAAQETGRLAAARRDLLDRCPDPLRLAQHFDPRVVATPAMELISGRLVATLRAWDGRLTVSVPPQQGKTTVTRWFALFALLDDPDRRVVFASHSMALARTSGRLIRGMVDQHGAPYGLVLDQAHHDAADWQLRGHLGGVLSASVESTLTGRPSDVMILDDLLSGEAEANSPAIRDKVDVWWESTARTRMAPGAPAVAIGTRWEESDILSRFIGEGWERINVPAVADGDTFDSLDRGVGEYLVSTRGTLPADWDTIRREAGERAWAALFQGRPAPLEGGIFRQVWIDDHRTDTLPERLAATAVAIDPADTGQGDEAGILIGSRAGDGTIYVHGDRSGMLSQGEWARRALLAAVVGSADTIVQESNLGMGRALRDGWAVIQRQAQALAGAPSNGHGDDDRIIGALAALTAARDVAAADEDQLREVLPLLDDILTRPSSGPCSIIAVTPRQSKYVRAHAVTGLYETGRARHVGRLARLEHEMTCLPAGTLVGTDRGQVPIEEVVAGDRAWTRAGWRRITWSGPTKVESCMAIRTSSGAVLHGTEDHRIWVTEHGWMSMKDLVPGHRILECRTPEPAPPSSSRGASTASTATATTRPGRPAAGSNDFCTATSGCPRTTAQSRTATTSTTAITTRRTTTRQTWRRYLQVITSGIIRWTGAGSAPGRPSSALLHGWRTGPGVSRPSTSARTAAVVTCRLGSEPSTAPRDAGRTTTVSGIGSWSAPGTAPSDGVRSTTVLSVERPRGLAEPVYDISVEDRHEFFANGVLVHNCWQPGQKSPNRLDTLAHLLTHLDTMRAATSVARSSGRGSALPLSTSTNPRRPGVPRSIGRASVAR